VNHDLAVLEYLGTEGVKFAHLCQLVNKRGTHVWNSFWNWMLEMHGRQQAYGFQFIYLLVYLSRESNTILECYTDLKTLAALEHLEGTCVWKV